MVINKKGDGLFFFFLVLVYLSGLFFFKKLPGMFPNVSLKLRQKAAALERAVPGDKRIKCNCCLMK